jgi:hypothetical protein
MAEVVMVKNLAEKRPITLGGREPYFRRFLAAVQLSTSTSATSSGSSTEFVTERI